MTPAAIAAEFTTASVKLRTAGGADTLPALRRLEQARAPIGAPAPDLLADCLVDE